MVAKKSKASSLHVRSDDGKHLNGRISLAGSDPQDIPTPALSLSGGNAVSRKSNDLLDVSSVELNESISLAADRYRATLVDAEETAHKVPLRFDDVHYRVDGSSLIAHISEHHSLSAGNLPVLDGADTASDRQTLEDFHGALHAREVSALLASRTEGQAGNTLATHYHARDLSNNPNVEWAEASELLQYAATHNEMEDEEKYLSEDEGKEAIFARKLAEAKASGLYDAIKAFGVTEAILVVSAEDGADEGYPEGYIYDGYHRLAAAVDINYQMLIPYSWA